MSKTCLVLWCVCHKFNPENSFYACQVKLHTRLRTSTLLSPALPYESLVQKFYLFNVSMYLNLVFSMNCEYINYIWTCLIYWWYLNVQGSSNWEQGHCVVVHSRVPSCTMSRGLPYHAYCIFKLWSEASQFLWKKSNSKNATKFPRWFTCLQGTRFSLRSYLLLLVFSFFVNAFSLNYVYKWCRNKLVALNNLVTVMVKLWL